MNTFRISINIKNEYLHLVPRIHAQTVPRSIKAHTRTFKVSPVKSIGVRTFERLLTFFPVFYCNVNTKHYCCRQKILLHTVPLLVLFPMTRNSQHPTYHHHRRLDSSSVVFYHSEVIRHHHALKNISPFMPLNKVIDWLERIAWLESHNPSLWPPDTQTQIHNANQMTTIYSRNVPLMIIKFHYTWLQVLGPTLTDLHPRLPCLWSSQPRVINTPSRGP